MADANVNLFSAQFIFILSYARSCELNVLVVRVHQTLNSFSSCLLATARNRVRNQSSHWFFLLVILHLCDCGHILLLNGARIALIKCKDTVIGLVEVQLGCIFCPELTASTAYQSARESGMKCFPASDHCVILFYVRCEKWPAGWMQN